jgi:hypothetical protein
MQMDQSKLIAKIKQDLEWSKYFQPDNYEFKPAWKHAFYNPAEKDKQGAVVVRQSPGSQIMLAALTLWLIFIYLVSKDYQKLLIPLFLIVANIGYTILLYKPLFIRISATGIIFKEQTYHWEDFIGAYICVVRRGKSSEVGLLLIRQNGEYVHLDLSSIRKLNRIGTAIRDFQPPVWKNLN